MNAGKAPPAVIEPVGRPEIFESTSRLSASLRPATRGLEGRRPSGSGDAHPPPSRALALAGAEGAACPAGRAKLVWAAGRAQTCFQNLRVYRIGRRRPAVRAPFHQNAIRRADHRRRPTRGQRAGPRCWRQGGRLRSRPSDLSQHQSGAADRSRADRLRVPAGAEKQGRQINHRRHPTADDAARLAAAKLREVADRRMTPPMLSAG